MSVESARAKVVQLYKRLEKRRPDIQEMDRYFRGEQPLAYATEQWRQFHQDRYTNFSDNWCGVVGSSPSERIRVNGFRLDDGTQVLSPAEKELWRGWDINELDMQSSQGFLASITKKRSYVLVWGDKDDEPVITWEDPEQVIVEYDPARPQRAIAALKVWKDETREYATLYLADELWKWSRPMTQLTIVGRTDWQPREIVGEKWPLPHPMRIVPIVEVPNRPMLGGEPLSDIAGTVAMQDAVNLLWAYLFTSADHASMPARVVTGADAPKVPILDENGQKVGEKPVALKDLAQGRLLWLTGKDAGIDQWDAAKLDVFTDVINIAVRHIAAQTRTPVHYIVGELTNVNGETLLAGEAGLVKKVEEFQLFAGAAVRKIFRRVALVRGDTAVADACRVGTVQWANAETRSGPQLADALLKWKQIGFPFAWIAEKAGLSQTEIARVIEQREAEASDPLLERLVRDVDPVDAPVG